MLRLRSTAAAAWHGRGRGVIPRRHTTTLRPVATGDHIDDRLAPVLARLGTAIDTVKSPSVRSPPTLDETLARPARLVGERRQSGRCGGVVGWPHATEGCTLTDAGRVRCARVASVAGGSNTGKSMLVNQLLASTPNQPFSPQGLAKDRHQLFRIRYDCCPRAIPAPAGTRAIPHPALSYALTQGARMGVARVCILAHRDGHR